MYCKECGKEVNDKAVVCLHCGCSVSKEELVKSFSGWAMFGLIVATWCVSLVGFIVGGINLKYKERNGQAIFLICWGVLSLIGDVITWAFLFGLLLP